ncbi:MAG: membrane dipeptidase [Bacteroidales bacterium]|nr:membrane dipeptidase [Bacteroidales bacterium]
MYQEKPLIQTNHKPVIGISANHCDETSRIADAYYTAIRKAGGVPLLIPVIGESDYLKEICDKVDGIVMSGGGDIDPSYINAPTIPEAGTPDPERDAYDVALIKEAQARQLPILGICRGMQILNIVFGGDIYQDINKEYGPALMHSQETPKWEASHRVDIKAKSRLAQITNTLTAEVNSLHHQAVKNIANEFVASAFSPDGICEAIEHPYYPMIGVQWHPEQLMRADDTISKALFNWLIEEANYHRRAKELHQQIVTLDSHTDTPMVWTPDTNLGERCDEAQVDFVKMAEGQLDAVFTVAYIPQEPLNEQTRQKAFDNAKEILTRLQKQVDSNSDKAAICKTVDEIYAAKTLGKRIVVPAVENGFAIGKDLGKIQQLYDLGMRYLTLCHNGDNDICDSANRTNHTHHGLSAFGHDVVKELNNKGIVIDLSHAGEETFWQVVACSATPVVCTHSSSRALCNHPRNLSDEQLKALADKGGVCQICLYSGFLVEDGEATIADAIAHLNHMVAVAGIEHVGFGSDFDGGGSIIGCRAANEEFALTVALMKEGYSNHDIALLRGGNFLRVMNKIQQTTI